MTRASYSECLHVIFDNRLFWFFRVSEVHSFMLLWVGWGLANRQHSRLQFLRFNYVSSEVLESIWLMPMKLVKPKSPCNGQVGRDIPDGLKGSLSFNKIDLNLLKVVSRLLKSRPKVIPQLFQSRLKTVQKLSQSCLKVVPKSFQIKLAPELSQSCPKVVSKLCKADYRQSFKPRLK